MQKIEFQNTANLPTGYEERIHNEMRFGLFIPPTDQKQQKLPFVLSLHGKLDITSWNLPWYNEPIISSDPCIVVTPKTLNPNFAWGNSKNEYHTHELLVVLEILELLKKEFNVDIKRMYVHGASMGGFGTFNLLAKNTDMFAAAFAVCGGGSQAIANKIKNIPLWIFHGDSDPTVSVEQSRTLYKAIVDSGGKKVRYTEYPGVGHDSWINAWKEPTLLKWFLAQRKNQKTHSPKPITNFRYKIIEATKILLSWNPSQSKNIWHYKIFCDSQLIAEVDNFILQYIDLPSELIQSKYTIVVVNYFFKGSDPTSITIDSNLKLPVSE